MNAKTLGFVFHGGEEDHARWQKEAIALASEGTIFEWAHTRFVLVEIQGWLDQPEYYDDEAIARFRRDVAALSEKEVARRPIAKIPWSAATRLAMRFAEIMMGVASAENPNINPGYGKVYAQRFLGLAIADYIEYLPPKSSLADYGMSVQELAKAKGVSVQAVRDAIRARKIADTLRIGEGKRSIVLIDPVEAAAWQPRPYPRS